jgi:hypothetical protein
MPVFQLLVCCCVNLRTNGCFTFLPPQVIGQRLTLEGLTTLGQLTKIGTWELLEHEDWEPNKLWALLLRRRSKGNLTFAKVINSFWVKLVPSWMGHTIGIIYLIITIFYNVPLTQRFKSSKQNQCLWSLEEKHVFATSLCD